MKIAFYTDIHEGVARLLADRVVLVVGAGSAIGFAEVIDVAPDGTRNRMAVSSPRGLSSADSSLLVPLRPPSTANSAIGVRSRPADYLAFRAVPGILCAFVHPTCAYG